MYPVGIPLLYAYILWINRDSLNPRVQTDANAGESSGPTFSFLAKDDRLTKESMEELNEKLERRMQNPNLVPSMFLWKDFGEKSLAALCDLVRCAPKHRVYLFRAKYIHFRMVGSSIIMLYIWLLTNNHETLEPLCTEFSARAGASTYYFEVIDCGRRILLTGALIFIKPNTPEQAAVACMFAFASLLGFELLRPHLDPMDSWIYRLVRPLAAISLRDDAYEEQAGEHFKNLEFSQIG